MDIFDEIDKYDNLFSSVDSLDDRCRMNINVPLRYLRDADDPYSLNQEAFKIRYQFSQESVKKIILPLVLPELQKINNRGLPLSPELQILVALRFYATASFQIVCGDLLNVSQPSASNIIATISKLLALKHNQYIKYPKNMQEHRLQFCRLGQYGQHRGLQNIDGAIGCTHVKIVDTPGVHHHEVYKNRKSYFSVNVQAVVGPNYEFLDIVARWAGSTHDSRIFEMSNLRNKYVQGIHDGRLVGDSGYPCLPYLLTPVNSPQNISEKNYNKVHAKTRNIAERTFGQWKRRFPCLRRGMGNKLSTVSNIIVACAVLFNISKRIGDEPTESEGFTDEAIGPEVLNFNLPTHLEDSPDGFAVRKSIISSYGAS